MPNGAGSCADFGPFSGHFHRPKRGNFTVPPDMTREAGNRIPSRIAGSKASASIVTSQSRTGETRRRPYTH